MAAINPPGWLQNAGATHTAEQMRNWLNLSIGGNDNAGTLLSRGGVHPNLGTNLAVSQTASPSMAVVVGSGLAAVPGSEGVKQGSYAVMNDGNVTLSVAASHATLPRIDSVVFRVEDAQYSGVNNACSLAVITGTAASSPSAPTLPVNSLELYRISVGAAVTTITNANLTDRRTNLAGIGGVIQCVSTNRPLNPMPGQLIFESDTRLMRVNDNGWIQVYPSTNKIAESILGSAAASVTFSAIPSTFRHLTLSIMARGDVAAQFTGTRLQFNGDTSTSYDYQQIDNTIGVVQTFEGLNQNGADLGEVPGNTTIAGSVSTHTVQIPWYTNTVFWKSGTSLCALSSQTSGGQAGQFHNKHYSWRWRNTGAVINSITIFPQSGNFVANSSFALFGLQ